MLVRELCDGAEVDQVLLVREVERRTRRDGGAYLRLQVSDRSGVVGAVVWDGVAEAADLVRAGAVLRLSGRFAVHARYGPQIAIHSVGEPEADSFNLDDLLDGPQRAPEQM